MPRISVALTLCLGAVVVPVAVAQSASLKALTRTEIENLKQTLDKSVLPSGAKAFELIDRQSFHLQLHGHSELTMIPVRFSFSEPGLVAGIDRKNSSCGVYLLAASSKDDLSGKAHFTNLFDTEIEGSVQCSGIEGVGLARNGGPHPEVILLFSVHTVHRSWSDPYLISWSDNDARYVFDPISPPAGVTPTDKLTVAQVRGWLNRRK